MNKPASVLSASFSPARFTTAEFLRMCEAGAFDDMKVELVNGELERVPPPGNEHGRRQMMVGIRLSRVIAEELLRGEVGIDLGHDTLLGCDAAILVAPVWGNGVLQPSEVTLAIEVSETTHDRDMGLKRIKYASAGIPNYWVIDGDRSVVHVWGEPLAVPGTDQTIVIA